MEMSTTQRKALPKKSFALPSKRSKSGGSGGYPINDVSHARNALSRVAAYGTPEEQAKVRAAVYGKYPAMKKRKVVRMQSKSAK